MTATTPPRSPSIKALSAGKISALKMLIFVLSLIPVGLLLLAFFQDELGDRKSVV